MSRQYLRGWNVNKVNEGKRRKEERNFNSIEDP
jgi:hypothetical protein